MRRSRSGLLHGGHGKKNLQSKDSKSIVGRAKQQQIATTDLLQMMGKASRNKLEGLELVKAVADQARVKEMGNIDWIEHSSVRSAVRKTYERERSLMMKDVGQQERF